MAMNLLQHAGRRLLDEGGDDDELEEELEFPMTALEFGAGFLEGRVGKRDIGKQ